MYDVAAYEIARQRQEELIAERQRLSQIRAFRASSRNLRKTGRPRPRALPHRLAT